MTRDEAVTLILTRKEGAWLLRTLYLASQQNEMESYNYRMARQVFDKLKPEVPPNVTITDQEPSS